jgi:hypothetical protein
MNKTPKLNLKFEPLDDDFTLCAKSIIEGQHYFISIESEEYYPIYFGDSENWDLDIDLSRFNTCSSLEEAKIECEKHQKNIYLSILKIADEQGLLTAEASLALKPNHWIEWDNTSTTCHSYGKTKVNVSFIIFYHAETGYTVNSLTDNKGHKKIGVFDTGQECIDFCQNWLDNYLKENKNV